MWTSRDMKTALGIDVPHFQTAMGVSIDTRTLQKGDLFVALKGETDGHAYVSQALEKGAAAVVIDHALGIDPSREIVVPDTFKALEAMGQYARKNSQARIVAVTGSAGKTTTKEMLLHVLSHFGETHASVASYNNHWGVPLSLARMPSTTQFGIFEIGMNNPGEIAPLAKQVSPDAAIITTVAEAHIGNMGSLNAIAEEKAEIFEGLSQNGLAIISVDHAGREIVERKAHQKATSVVTVGCDTRADVRLISSSPLGECVGQIGGKTLHFTLPFPGTHYACNAMLVLGLIESWGMDVEQAAQALKDFPALDGRGRQHRLPSGSLLIDDAYNANPASIRAGLSVVSHIQGDYKIAVLGEMLELGSSTVTLHQGLIPALCDAGVSQVFAVGQPGMKSLFEALPPAMQGYWTSTAAEMIPHVLKKIDETDVIFVKGSKGSKVSQIVQAILENVNPVKQRA